MSLGKFLVLYIVSITVIIACFLTIVGVIVWHFISKVW